MLLKKYKKIEDTIYSKICVDDGNACGKCMFERDCTFLDNDIYQTCKKVNLGGELAKNKYRYFYMIEKNVTEKM